jgi:hypothetical protein
MAIDIFNEKLLSIHQVRSLPPYLRENDKPSGFNTPLRHIVRGVPGPGGKRIKLEAIRMPNGGYKTSAEAVERFIRKLNPAGTLPPPRRRTEEIRRAHERTAAAGIRG